MDSLELTRLQRFRLLRRVGICHGIHHEKEQNDSYDDKCEGTLTWTPSKI